MKNQRDKSWKSPLLKAAWNAMPKGIRKTVSSEPIIPVIAAEAKSIAARNKNFVRSDQGQIIGIYPDKEIYYGPSAGLEELRELVGRFWTLAYRLENRKGIPPGGLNGKHVAIVTGATEGLTIVMHVFASGRKVGLMPLHWSNYKGIIRNAGGDPVVLDFFDKRGHPDFHKAEDLIEANRISTLLVNFPNNPSGDVLSENELNSLTDMARRKNLILISDEVYNFIRYKGTPQSLLADAPERTVVISSASKEYLIPGARTGYVIAAEEAFIDWISKLIRSFSSSPNVLGQQLLIGMLRNEVADMEEGKEPRLITSIKKELRDRLMLTISLLDEMGLTLAGRDKDFPSGAISILVRLPDDLGLDDKAFIEKALEFEKFSAVPGSVFGAPGCIRVGYAGMPPEKIKKFARNLKDVLTTLRQSQ